MEYLQQCFRFLSFFCILFDVCCTLTIVSESGNGDVICDRRNQTDVNVEDLPMYCQNGGECVLSGCSCETGFYGTVCQHSVVNAVIVVIVCILPPASWTLVFCYGCKERRRKRRLRQQRRHLENGHHSNRPDMFSAAIYDDLPPRYCEIAHDNPIALCGMDDAFYQTSTDPPPPKYDDVLKKAIECGANLPRQAARYSMQLELNIINEEPEPQIPSSSQTINTNQPQEQSHRADASTETNSQTISISAVPFYSSREGLIDDADETDPNNNTGQSAPISSNEQSETRNSVSSVIVTSTQHFHTSRDDLIADDEEMDCDQSGHVTSRMRTLTNELALTPDGLGAYLNHRHSLGGGEPSALSSVVVNKSDPLRAHSSQIDLLAADQASDLWID